ncbi:MAG: GldG family protein [bacterium]|nr:GldG family protein [bacterium]MDI1336918.1 GldG family protein [Lacunisphaera sp.]
MHLADSFRAARWIRFINLLLQAVLFLGLFGGLNYIAQNHLLRFDLTANRRHSLSAETKSYLDQLERNVSITVTLMQDSDNEELLQVYRDISGLLREYTYATSAGAKGRVTVEYLDIYKFRKRAEELGLDQPNVLLLTCDGHRRVLTIGDFYRTKERRRQAFLGEATLTAAILDVSSPVKKKIYFLSGHGEMRTDDLDPVRGLSQLRDELRQRNFDILPLDLNLTHKIPDDTALLLLASPQGRYQAFEEELLRNYLTTRAGRLILLLDPGRPLGLENLLFDWGVIVYDNVIIDPDPSSLTETNDLRLWNFLPDPGSHITDQLINNVLPVLVGPARVVSDDLGRPEDDGLSVKKLIATSKNAWGETNYRQRVPAEYTPGQDLKGQLGVMVISERLKPANNLPLSVRGGRLAVVGTADLVTNNRIFNPGNLNLFLATVNWTVDRDTQLNIPARPIQLFALTLSQEELVRLRLGLLLVVPGVVALLGCIVYWTRRN